MRETLRVLGLAGSPRRQGNTEVLLDQFLSGAQEAGAQVHKVWVPSLDVAGCVSCGGCSKDGVCVVQDDFQAIDQRLIEMARTTGAGPWRVVSRVLVPGALPGFLVGLRFSLAYSILGLVAAETVNADEGLGFLITQAQTYLQTNKVFVGLVIYSVLGLLADQFVRILERVLLRWRPSYEAV